MESSIRDDKRSPGKTGLLRRCAAGATALLCVLSGGGYFARSAAAAGGPPIQIKLNHWQNVGLTPNPNFPKYWTWVNGDLNAQHNSYAETDVVPYRFVIENLNYGTTYGLTFEYETTKSQDKIRHATDYLQTFDATEGNGKWPNLYPNLQATSVPADPNPCDPEVEGGKTIICTGAAQNVVIPKDPCVTAANVSQPDGVFSFWASQNSDGTGPLALTFPAPQTSTYTVTTSGGALLSTNGSGCPGVYDTGTTYTKLTVYFTTPAYSGNGKTPTIPYLVMAIGGHLSSFLDWGVDQSSGSIHGAPWHFRLTVLQKQGAQKWTTIADGNRDRSINIYKISAIRIGKVCTNAPAGNTDKFDFDLVVDEKDIQFSLVCGGEFSTRVVHGHDVTYSIEELTPPLNWTLTGAICTDSNNNLIDAAPILDEDTGKTVGFTFTAQGHDRIFCTFTNDYKKNDTPPPPGSGRRWMTGGGSVLDSGGTILSGNASRVTHGFHLLCGNLHGNRPPKSSNNLEVNWIDSATGQEYHFHLDGSSIDYSKVICDNDGGNPENPKTLNNWDRYKYNQISAQGRLNGDPNATATWIFTDHGEPGANRDGMTITITSPNLPTPLIVVVPVSPTSGNIKSGNHQAH